MKASLIITVFVVSGSILILGCSSLPSTKDGREILEDLIDNQAKGVIELVDFEKTNGKEGEFMGVEMYEMDFRAQIEFKEDCYWGSPFGGFEVVTEKPGPMNSFKFIGKKQAKAGQRTTISGTLSFEKTENGWKGRLMPQ